MAQKLKQHFSQIFGFACFQAFFFSLLYLEIASTVELAGFSLVRFDLLLFFLVCAVCLFVLVKVPTQVTDVLLEPHLMFVYAGVLIAVVVLSLTFDSVLIDIVLFGVCASFSFSLLLFSWGKVFEGLPLEDASFIVICGSVAGALTCIICCVAGYPFAAFIIDLLPLGAASALHEALRRISREADSPARRTTRPLSAKALDLSFRILLGSVVFGLASGFADSFVGAAIASPITFPLALIVFVMLGIAALQLFFDPGFASLEGSDAGQVLQFAQPSGALRYVYRLSLLLMIAGYLFMPALRAVGIDGHLVVSAGFLSLYMTLTVLFLNIASVTSTSPMYAFAFGFSALFAGEALGIACGNALNLSLLGSDVLLFVYAAAGLLVLISFMFLFTESDLAELVAVEEATDYFDQACEYLVSTYELSKREAEILPLALKGRTGERIAEQFTISKSTVDTHLRRMYAKCGVHSRQELIDLSELVAEQVSRRV